MTEELIDDQIYFLIADSDKTLSEQLMDDPLGILNSSLISAVLPINTAISHISTDLRTENLCGSISKEMIIDDQIYFLISDSDKTLWEQLMDDSLGILNSS